MQLNISILSRSFILTKYDKINRLFVSNIIFNVGNETCYDIIEMIIKEPYIMRRICILFIYYIYYNYYSRTDILREREKNKGIFSHSAIKLGFNFSTAAQPSYLLITQALLLSAWLSNPTLVQQTWRVCLGSRHDECIPESRKMVLLSSPSLWPGPWCLTGS